MFVFFVRYCVCVCVQVNSAKREGDQVVLEVEPSKGGDKQTMTVDVVLVSAGEGGRERG